MQIGMVGLGRMGSDMVRRLVEKGHDCVVLDLNAALVKQLELEGAHGTYSLATLVKGLAAPRVVWLMLPAALVDHELAQLMPLLAPGDIVIDGGNSYYHDDIRRGAECSALGVHYVDVGTSGGIFGRERGYCLMIGGENVAVEHLDPIFAALAPGNDSADTNAVQIAPTSTAVRGYLHCGSYGAGHFVKMVHNGIEYGLMAAYAEGMNLLQHANVGAAESHAADAETTPLRHPQFYQYDFDLPEIAQVWRRGSVISSWLLDLTAAALKEDPALTQYEGRVSDSGEGRWTILAGVDTGVPTPVLSAALYQRFSSRGASDYSNKLLSAMRHAFGGHIEKPGLKKGD